MLNKEIENYTNFLLSAAIQKCGNLEDAQDLTQDTLLAALTYLSKDNAINDMKGWLITVLNRKFYYKLRQKYKMSITSIGDETDFVDDTDYFDGIGLSDEAESVRRSVAYLSKLHREVIVRYYMNGHSVEKIAGDLNIPQGTVKSRLSNGRKHLKKELENNMESYAKQSYEPVYLSISNSGSSGMNGEPGSFVDRNLIVQNLLYLAYEKPITETDLAKAIGIPTVYVEQIIRRLVEGELMVRVGDKVYTDFIISNVIDKERYIPAQKQLVSDNSELFLRAIKKAFAKIKEMDFYQRFTVNQRNALELYAMFKHLDNGVANAFLKISDTNQVFKDRPNGGRWIAFGHVFFEGYDWKNYMEQVKHSYAGERHTYLENYFGSKSIASHLYDPDGFPVRIYSKVIDDDNLIKLLHVVESDIDIENTGFNVELLKSIPFLVDCKILRYDNDKPKVDIPVFSPDEWRTVQEILSTAQNKFVQDIMELLRVFLVDKKLEIPKHLTSVPLLKQYAWSISALTMATIRTAMQTGVIHDGKYDEENQCPYPIVFIVDK
jgi:RNA polymerase sigma factor, sigma-70 family